MNREWKKKEDDDNGFDVNKTGMAFVLYHDAGFFLRRVPFI